MAACCENGNGPFGFIKKLGISLLAEQLFASRQCL
jgi:hypothetical protein